MLRRRKAKRPRALPIPVLDEENEVAEQSVDQQSNPDASYPDTAPAACCSLDSEKGLQAAVEESPPVDNLLKRIKELEQERDFLRLTLASVCGKEKQKKKKKKKDTSSESDELNSSSSSSSSSLPSSSSEDERCSKKKNQKRREPKKRGQDLLSPVLQYEPSVQMMFSRDTTKFFVHTKRKEVGQEHS
ncbi:protein FAM133-like [Megalobrama amblycephala]|uniref:protein FAM133-like n=1 Tax=Megalobrama amblycephala TaxID=75352 RepID=UPI002014776A|nr:protein FAM133-like [Megalobrama amblycephala]